MKKLFNLVPKEKTFWCVILGVTGSFIKMLEYNVMKLILLMTDVLSLLQPAEMSVVKFFFVFFLWQDQLQFIIQDSLSSASRAELLLP